MFRPPAQAVRDEQYQAADRRVGEEPGEFVARQEGRGFTPQTELPPENYGN